VPSIEDDFTGPDLRRDLWVDSYLPQWTTPERSRARWRFVEGGLELRIEEDQPDWREEDGPLRVSNLQTGVHSGALGTREGTHRHRPDGLVVRHETGTRLLWAPSAGHLEVTVSASRGERCMLAVWLVGTEHRSPADSGEICVFEIDAAAIGTGTTTARSGLKAHRDPRLRTDMAEVRLPFDASERHTWSVTWGHDRTVIRCQGAVVRAVDQAPDYPLLLMIDLFEIGPPGGPYPKTAVVHRVAGRGE